MNANFPNAIYGNIEDLLGFVCQWACNFNSTALRILELKTPNTKDNIYTYVVRLFNSPRLGRIA